MDKDQIDWRRYTDEKRQIEDLNLPPEKYEEAIQRLCKEYRL